MEKHDRLLTWPQVEALVAMGRKAAWERWTSGLFPRPMKLPNSNRNRWRESEIQAWIAGNWEAC
ncbi:MAG: hypothetical protein B0D91_11130 [Oceanospirillales bacterium LUC14_002_19_P2]|nr:MAG: hypothetical protein B0D91_11130 [Oceanospirillales bacterium LUC14_002_19_P2]